MTEPEIDTQISRNHCRGLGKYGRWAACGIVGVGFHSILYV